MTPNSLPIVEELLPAPDPAEAFRRLSHRPHCLFFDSALRHKTLGRYSFLMAEPFAFLEIPVGAADPFAQLQTALQPFTANTIPSLPPFQGGLAGLFSYDLHRSLEQINAPRFDEFQIPAIAVGLYDTVLAWDHATNRAWIISHGYPEQQANARLNLAMERIANMESWLTGPNASQATRLNGALLTPSPSHPITLSPCHPVPGPPGLTSNFSAEAYREAVRKCIEYIYAGDIFQVNFAQRLLYPAEDDAVSLYLRLRERNPATFAAYFDAGAFQLASASPERFLSVRERRVEARPIKGTRRRTFVPEADLFRGDELQANEKDRAENVMIVDLLRNDLSRVCEAESVRVTQLCGLETYEYVQHLVSVLEGRLSSDKQPLDLIREAFPGGSITGAPKVRAMEIIAELEPTARGAYCGSLGYLGFDGTLDFNILIRTITAASGWWQFPVGGGIVAQSQVDREYEETWHKAEGMLRALRS